MSAKVAESGGQNDSAKILENTEQSQFVNSVQTNILKSESGSMDQADDSVHPVNDRYKDYLNAQTDIGVKRSANFGGVGIGDVLDQYNFRFLPTRFRWH